jgi:hypothetical protein
VSDAVSSRRISRDTDKKKCAPSELYGHSKGLPTRIENLEKERMPRTNR